jgi:hypothetical protein
MQYSTKRRRGSDTAQAVKREYPGTAHQSSTLVNSQGQGNGRLIYDTFCGPPAPPVLSLIDHINVQQDCWYIMM